MKFMQLSKTEKFNPKNVYGSYAGAIGLGQFMPSNYEAYGVDFNVDGLDDNLPRKTVVQEFISTALMNFVLWKWWTMKINPKFPQIKDWATAAMADYEEAVNNMNYNSINNHRKKPAKIKYRPLG